MPKRKHRGGPADRPHRRDRADSPPSSRAVSDRAPFGQRRHAGGPPGKPQMGRQQTAKSGWAAKPARHPGPGRAAKQASPSVIEARPDHSPNHSQDRPGRNRLWLYGLHAVKAALDNPRRRHHRLLLTREAAEAIQSSYHNINGLTPETATREDIARVLPPGAVHQGAALLTEPLAATAIEDVIDRAATAETSVILILDQVTDPQNVGAILRSAAAFGADAVVVPDRHAPPETGALVKAASGAVEIVPLVRVVNLARAMADLKAAGFWCAGLDGHAPQTLAAADMSGKVALVLGAEGEGLRRLTRDQCDILVRLPISERMESLNVSAAAAVALYELARKG